MNCTHCDDTGSLEKDLLGYLNCTHCGVALERTEFEKWAVKNHPYIQLLAGWMIYQHGKAAAVTAGYKLVPLEPNDQQQTAGAGAISAFDTTALNRIWTANKVYRDMVAAAPDSPCKS